MIAFSQICQKITRQKITFTFFFYDVTNKVFFVITYRCNMGLARYSDSRFYSKFQKSVIPGDSYAVSYFNLLEEITFIPVKKVNQDKSYLYPLFRQPVISTSLDFHRGVGIIS